MTVYGSIQQDARGPVGLVGGTGYYKYYSWDPRLTLYGPPYYLTPGTPSWALDSSAESFYRAVPVPAGGPELPVLHPTDVAGGSLTDGEPHQRLYDALTRPAQLAPVGPDDQRQTGALIPDEGSPVPFSGSARAGTL